MVGKFGSRPEGYIQEIGGQSVQMDRKAFSDSMINTIFRAFLFQIQTELANFEEDDGRELLSSYLDYIAKLREKRHAPIGDQVGIGD